MGVKAVVFISLSVVGVCFSMSAFSQNFERSGNIITYKGNRFEMSEKRFDTVTIIDPIEGKEVTRIEGRDARPITMNGKPIAAQVDQQPYYTGDTKDLGKHLLINLKDELSKLKNGQYTLGINDVVVDENGKVVYFDYGNVSGRVTDDEMAKVAAQTHTAMTNASDTGKHGVVFEEIPTKPVEISKKDQDYIFNKVCRLMETAPVFKPATLNGKKALSFYYCRSFSDDFKIEHHKLYSRGLDEHWEWKEL